MNILLICVLLLQSLSMKEIFYAEKQIGDKIEVYKHKHLLVLKSNNKVIASFPASFGYNQGKKTFSGDGKTPEGLYYIIGKKRKSVFLHSLHISYPNQNDINNASKYNKDPGNEITIHGTGDDASLKYRMQKKENWTRGCIGLSNLHIRELFNKVRVGTPIEIYP